MADLSVYSKSCEEWAEYPSNLAHRPEFTYELKSYATAIKTLDPILFDPNRRKRQLHMWDLKDGQGKLEPAM